ncbi:MAG TPA: hypothetical protein VNN80_34500 [Polyangiaceae bacterium]|nr:hypothetical protein [Polyangiaceae bacterium]
MFTSEADAAGGPRTVTVNAAEAVGRIRSLQGGHWDPGPAGEALSNHYLDLGIDMIRTHDASGIDGSGAGDIDGVGVDRIFPDWAADPANPASYNFGPTDALIENIRDVGAEVFFRVGRSNIGGFANNAVPADFAKYADVVKHVVMHYNKGWANGFRYGIRYFEVWNEPDFLPFWAGTSAQYYELYERVTLAIKAADSRALVGGPAITTFNDYTGLRASFLQFLAAHHVPLDFYSFHKYTNKSNDPLDYARVADAYRHELDSFGFTRTKLINTEFGTSLSGDPIIGGEAGRAAFTAVAQVYMQNAPIDKALSYMLTDPSQNPGFLEFSEKENLAFSAISSLNCTPIRLATSGGDDTGFAVLSGRSAGHDEIRVVIANYEISPTLMGPIPGGNDESIDIPGLGHLGTMSYLDRRTITYQDTEGYNLAVKGIPKDWGDLSVEQFRIDNANDLTLVSSTVVTKGARKGGDVRVSGTWTHAVAAPPVDPSGVAQGIDVIVIKSTR